MKLVLINYLSAVSGGALTYLKNITPFLIRLEKADKAQEIRFIILISEGQRKYISSEVGEERLVVVDPGKGLSRLVWEYRNLPALIRKYNIDIVFTPYQVTRTIDGIENIVMVRNMEPFTFHKYRYSFKTALRNNVLNYQTIKTIKKADKVIAVSNYVQDYLVSEKGLPKDKLFQVYHGRDEGFFPAENRALPQELIELGAKGDYIFTCGSLLPYRKCEDILEAFNCMDNEENIKLFVAGSGTDKNYSSRLHKLAERNSNVEMLGQVDHEIMKLLFRYCSLFVTATETEACPNIAIEAMSSGCRILSSDVDPMPEMFGPAAVYYKHGDHDDLLEKLKVLLSVPSTVNTIALKRAQDFTWEQCANNTYKSLKS